jgi:putative transposase
MPRLPRIAIPGLLHHVMARGIEKCTIFRRDGDYYDMIRRMQKVFTETGTLCYAWALMSNHIHLLLQSGLTPIGRVMQRLLTGYAVSFNLRYDRVGHLFQNRFKDIICQDEPYFLRLVQYIHLNGARAGLIATPEDLDRHPWSGHATLMGNINQPWQATEPVLQRFSKDPMKARQLYKEFVVGGWSLGKQEDLENGGSLAAISGQLNGGPVDTQDPQTSFDQRILGSADFAEEILKRADLVDRETSALRKLSLSELEFAVSAVMAVPAALLRTKNRAESISRAKAVLLYLATLWLPVSLAEVATLIQMSRGCASRSRERGRVLCEGLGLREKVMTQLKLGDVAALLPLGQ